MMNKKILVSLVCGLVGVVACNGGGGGGGGAPLSQGNYQLYSWDVPSSGVCPQNAPAGTIAVQGVVGSSGKLCGTGSNSGNCFTINTAATTNCVTGTYSQTVGGTTYTQTTTSSNCTYTSSTNSLYGIFQQSVSPSIQGSSIASSCFSVIPGTVSVGSQTESIQTKGTKTDNLVSSFSLENLIK